MDALLGKTAVLTVDYQNDFCHPDGAMAKMGFDVQPASQAAEKMQWFVEQIRPLGITIIHCRNWHSKWTDSAVWNIRHKGSDGLCRAGSWGAEFYGIKPEDDDFEIKKHRYSAFKDTSLDRILRTAGIQTLLIGGVVTNVCVESTVRDAFMSDYLPVVLSDCCACLYPEDQDHSLKVIGRFFGKVSDAESALTNLTKSPA